MITFDPNRPDFAPYGFTCVRWTPSAMRRPDHHNEIELNLLESGWVVYLLAGRKRRIEAGRLSAFWAAIPHQVTEFGPGTRYFVVTIPFAWFLQCGLPDRLVQPLFDGAIVGEEHTNEAVFDLNLFARWECDLRAGDETRRSIALLEMEARLRRLALRLPPLPSGPMTPRRRRGALLQGGLNNVERMACLIAQNYREPLSIADISREAGLHPNYAMALFKKTFGTTVIDYLTRHRVSHAQRLLATSDDKIVDVAFSSGFRSVSRFNDAFRRACGCSPRDYRKQHEVRA